jgi:Uri superfamily endonuclease
VSIDSKLVSELQISGVYTMLLFVPQKINITVGKLGQQQFPMGHYTYTGSALGKGAPLKSRISRHLKKEKRMFWHIDYLLKNKNVSIKAIIVTESKEKIECKVNRCLKDTSGAIILVRGFGASDCKNKCGSHLIYFPERVKTEKLIQKFAQHLQTIQGVLPVIVIK